MEILGSFSDVMTLMISLWTGKAQGLCFRLVLSLQKKKKCATLLPKLTCVRTKTIKMKSLVKDKNIPFALGFLACGR